MGHSLERRATARGRQSEPAIRPGRDGKSRTPPLAVQSGPVVRFDQVRLLIVRLAPPASAFVRSAESPAPSPPSPDRREKKPPPLAPPEPNTSARLCPRRTRSRVPPPRLQPLRRAATLRRPTLAPLCWRRNRSPARPNPGRPLRWNRPPPRDCFAQGSPWEICSEDLIRPCRKETPPRCSREKQGPRWSRQKTRSAAPPRKPRGGPASPRCAGGGVVPRRD